MVGLLVRVANEFLKEAVSINEISSPRRKNVSQKIRFLSRKPKISFILEIKDDIIDFSVNSKVKPDVVISCNVLDIAASFLSSKMGKNSVYTDLLKVSGDSIFEKDIWNQVRKLLLKRQEVLHSVLSDTLLCSFICAGKNAKHSSEKILKTIIEKIDNLLN